MPVEKACLHLVADGEYREICEQLITKYPNLRHRDFKHAKFTPSLNNGQHSDFRCTTVDFSSGAARVGRVISTFAELRESLQIPPHMVAPRYLHIVEGQSPQLSAVLGAELKVDPQVFMRHQRTALYDSEHLGGNSPCLASLISASSSYTLEIYEVRYFPGGFQTSSLQCADSLRYVALPGSDGRFEDIGVIAHKASFWSRSIGDQGWQALIMVDPPATSFFQASKNGLIKRAIPNVPYQGGYADFIPYADLDSMRAEAGPPRTSMFDDLGHYYSNHSSLLDIGNDPRSADLFLRKVAASQYMLLSQYCAGLLSHLEWRMSRQGSLETLSVPWLLQQWKDIQLSHRRVEDYSHAIRSVMRSLQLSIVDVNRQDWRSSRADFEDIQRHFDELLRKSDTLISSFGGLSGIISSRESLDEASTVGRLTILGMVFLPLSFVTGLFSMSESYLPGSNNFGVYWAVSIPMVVIVLLIPAGMMVLRRWHRDFLKRAHFSEYRYWEKKS